MSHRARPARRTQDVLVGADGSAASAHAIRYARAEAASSGGAVDVVHVVPDVNPVNGLFPVSPEELMDAGRAALGTSLEQAGPALDDVAERTHLRRGSVVATLAELARDARLAVVGSDRRPVSMRLLTGNVSTGVSARAGVPVVSVPDTWSGERRHGVVLVGVKHSDRAEALLAEAFEVARRRRARLLVLHAWRLPAAYDDLLTDADTLADWADRAERELTEAVAPWRASHPDVEVEVRCVHGQAAHALVTASEEADEVVVVRRARGVPAAAHLGSTARAVLLYAHCPVRVVPAGHAPIVPDLDLEAAGEPLARVDS